MVSWPISAEIAAMKTRLQYSGNGIDLDLWQEFSMELSLSLKINDERSFQYFNCWK